MEQPATSEGANQTGSASSRRGNDGWEEFNEREQLLLEGLRRRYNAVLHNRRHYFDLLCFIAFAAMYMALLGLQRRSFVGFDINRSFAHVVPQDDQGSGMDEFDTPQQVYEWMKEMVTTLWVDPRCGDGNCADGEEPAFGRLGCQVDCGWRLDLARIQVQLEYKFEEGLKRDLSFWNICKQGSCTVDMLESGGDGCYFEQKTPFQFFEGQFTAELYLPPEQEWVFCLQTPPPILSVAGRVSQVSMAQTERVQLSRSRKGFLGLKTEGPRPANSSVPRFAPPAGQLPPSKGGPVVNLLASWEYSRQQSVCERDCSLLAACSYRNPYACLDGMERLDAAAATREMCLSFLDCNETNSKTFLSLSTEDGGVDASVDPTFNCTVESSGFQDGSHIACPILFGGGLEEKSECAPGCPQSWVGDGVCDTDCVMSPDCGFDFADCCEEHFHVDLRHHFHCPSNENRLGEDPRVVVIGFRVLSTAQDPPAGAITTLGRASVGATNETTQATPPTSPPADTGPTADPPGEQDHHHLGRWVGVRNKMIGGILIHQTRTEELSVAVVDKSRFAYLGARLSQPGTPFSTKPYGRNPVFVQSSSLYVADAVNRTMELFPKDETQSKGVPYGFFSVPGTGRFYDGFPIFLDAEYSQSQVMDMLTYMVDGGYIDHHSRHISVQVLTYNAELTRFGTLMVHIYFKMGGVIEIHPQIEVFSVEMYCTHGDTARAFFEIVFVLLVVFATIIEVGQMRAVYLATGSVLRPYLGSFYKIVDLMSLSLMYTVIAIWCRFIVKYNNAFDVKLENQVYETFSDDVEARAKMLALANGGARMLDVMDKFSEVIVVTDLLDIYFFINFLNLMLMMIRLLKLTAFHPMLGIVARTLSRAAYDVAHFLVVAGIIFLTFAISANLAFGYRVKEFSTFGTSINTCFLMIIGEVGVMEQLQQLVQLKLLIAWIFFWIYMIVFFFILFQFFVAFVLAALTEIMESRGPRSTTVLSEVSNILLDESRSLLGVLSCRPRAKTGDRHVARDILRWLNAARGGADARGLDGDDKYDEGGTAPHGLLGSWSLNPRVRRQRGGEQPRVEPEAKVIVLDGHKYTYSEVREALERAKIARELQVSAATGGARGQAAVAPATPGAVSVNYGILGDEGGVSAAPEGDRGLPALEESVNGGMNGESNRGGSNHSDSMRGETSRSNHHHGDVVQLLRVEEGIRPGAASPETNRGGRAVIGGGNRRRIRIRLSGASWARPGRGTAGEPPPRGVAGRARELSVEKAVEHAMNRFGDYAIMQEEGEEKGCDDELALTRRAMADAATSARDVGVGVRSSGGATPRSGPVSVRRLDDVTPATPLKADVEQAE